MTHPPTSLPTWDMTRLVVGVDPERLDQAHHVEQILACLAAADTTDAAVQRAAGQVRGQRGRLDELETRFYRWPETATDTVFGVPTLYDLEQAIFAARATMNPPWECCMRGR